MFIGGLSGVLRELRGPFGVCRVCLSTLFGAYRMDAAESPVDAGPDVIVPDPTADLPSPEAGGDGGTGRKELTAAEVLELIRAGKDVYNVRVHRLAFRGEFPGPVRFKNCTLIQPQFHKATFLDDVAFVGCTLDRPSFRGRVTFEKGFDLGGSAVAKGTVAGLVVRGKFSAAFAEFRTKGVFGDCVFAGLASFWEAKFSGWADFKNCTFEADADFRSMHCDQGINFTRCVFHQAFLFRGANVEKKFDAGDSQFLGLVDLSKAKLHDFAYLEGIKQGPGQTFAFLNAVAERIRVRPEQLKGRLASENAGQFDDAMQEYGLLKRCYNALHRFDQEDWAFYRFKVAQRRCRVTTWKRPWTVWRQAGDYLFLDIGCGYGTNPLRAVRMAAVIILAFAAVYAANVNLFYTDKLPFSEEPRDGVANSLAIGLITSVSVFTSGMGGIREVAKGWMNAPVMVESIMGTLLFGLFIVAFSRKVIR